MTPSLTLVLAVLVGPGFETDRPLRDKSPIAQQGPNAPFGTAREAREAVSEVLKASNRASDRDPSETAPQLVAMYRRLVRSEKLPAAERRQLQARLRSRLAEQRSALKHREDAGELSLGGGVPGGAQELINLITTTIAPDTWEINGGKGSIYYFPNR